MSELRHRFVPFDGSKGRAAATQAKEHTTKKNKPPQGANVQTDVDTIQTQPQPTTGETRGEAMLTACRLTRWFRLDAHENKPRGINALIELGVEPEVTEVLSCMDIAHSYSL
jgi:hypothetical protein